MTITVTRLRAALALEPFDGRAAQRIMEPLHRGDPTPRLLEAPPREAAALAFAHEQDGALHLPLTLRHPELREHRGQVSLPGGRPEDGESLWETAWREAREEIALDPPDAEPLGVLEPVYIPVTHTHLHVHVATGTAPERFRRQPSEVDRVEVVPLHDLLDPALRRTKTMTFRDRSVEVPYFDLAGLVVWGATAMALSELAERLRDVESPPTA